MVSGVTIYEVAQHAGVGRSTVSRVINGAKNVAPPTRAAVEAAIKELGYSPSRAARSLVTKHAHAIGLIIPEELDRFFSDPFFSEVMAGVTRKISDSEYALNVMVASGDPDGRNANKVISFVTNGGVDGVILVGHRVGDTFINELTNKVPIVFGGREEPHDATAKTYCVDTDNRYGGYLAGRRLVDIGRKQIAVITGPQNMVPAKDRQDGFIAALDESNLKPVWVNEGDYSPHDGYRLAMELVDSQIQCDAIFAANDLMATGVLDALREREVRCPQDVAVVGFDDSVVATRCNPQLTTIRQPIRLLGEAMADVLLRVLEGQTPPSITLLDTELVIRQSG